MRITTVAGTIFALAGMLAAAQTPAVLAKTSGGWVKGTVLADGVQVYKGIPFAAPPVGARRWRPPQPAPPWKRVLVADHFGPPCMQAKPAGRIGPWTREYLIQGQPSEDCLYLNIWAPKASAGRRAPVLAWIYGGGFTSGGGGVPLYDGAALARRGVLVVDFNYRVGPFGFLALPQLAAESPHHSAGNYGLLDQIAALRWIQKNIAGFGGNPAQVTIAGQSAGAISVGMLLRSPLAQGLFARAIMMSGPAVLFDRRLEGDHTLSAAERADAPFARALGTESLAGMRQMPAARLLAAAQHAPFGPIEDGWVIPAQPFAGDSRVPVILGMVADDLGIGYYGFGPAPQPTLDAYHAGIAELCGKQAARCEALYPARNGRAGLAALRAARRDRARVSLYLWASAWRQAGGAVRTYYFDHLLPWPQHPEFGVFHSSELPYVFDNLRFMDRPWRPADHRLATALADYWTNFAKNADPNGAALPNWPAFDGRPQTMELGDRLGAMPAAAPARLAFWRQQLAR